MIDLCVVVIFFFSFSGDYRDLHSFPTRRSSDLSMPWLKLALPERNLSSSASIVDTNWGSPPCNSRSRRMNRFLDRKSTRLNSSHVAISYAVFCLKKKNIPHQNQNRLEIMVISIHTESLVTIL